MRVRVRRISICNEEVFVAGSPVEAVAVLSRPVRKRLRPLVARYRLKLDQGQFTLSHHKRGRGEPRQLSTALRILYRIADDMRHAGLTDVGAAAFRTFETRPGEGCKAILKTGYELLREPLLIAGPASEADLEATLSLLDDPDRAILSFHTWTAWGRRPS